MPCLGCYLRRLTESVDANSLPSTSIYDVTEHVPVAVESYGQQGLVDFSGLAIPLFCHPFTSGASLFVDPLHYILGCVHICISFHSKPLPPHNPMLMMLDLIRWLVLGTANDYQLSAR